MLMNRTGNDILTKDMNTIIKSSAQTLAMKMKKSSKWSTRSAAAVLIAPMVKKKKKLESKEGDVPIPKLYNFVSEAEQLLGVVHKALLPFQAPANEGFVMNAKYRDSNDKCLEEVELVCGKEGGAFQFKIDAKNEVINAATPVSGALQYYFDGDKWLNVHDHHDIRGIIVRDMLRLTSSAPKL